MDAQMNDEDLSIKVLEGLPSTYKDIAFIFHVEQTSIIFDEHQPDIL